MYCQYIFKGWRRPLLAHVSISCDLDLQVFNITLQLWGLYYENMVSRATGTLSDLDKQK